MFTIDIMFEDFNEYLEVDLLQSITGDMKLYFGMIEGFYDSFVNRIGIEFDEEIVSSTQAEDTYKIMLNEKSYFWVAVDDNISIEKLIKSFGSIYCGVVTNGDFFYFEVRFRIYDHINYNDDEYRMLSIEIRDEKIKNEFFDKVSSFENDEIIAILER